MSAGNNEYDSTYISSIHNSAVWCGSTLYPGQYSTISVGVQGALLVQKDESNKKLLLLEDI
jgi:hypothetical protein